VEAVKNLDKGDPMARTARSAKLETRDARLKLPRLPGDKPHWQDVHKGLGIGYRPGSQAWIIRAHVGGTAYRHKKIGTADDFAPANGEDILSFRQVAKRAHTVYEELLAATEATNSAKVEPEGPYTVRNAIDAYIAFLAAERRTAADARTRADALILPVLGDIALGDLKRAKLRSWLDGVAATPPRLRTRKGQAQRYRAIDADDEDAKRQRQSSANRTWTILKAALNKAWRYGKADSDVEWRTVESFADVDAARPRWLDNDEPRRFINGCQGEFKTLVRAALHTGAAYGNLAALNVGDFAAHRVRVQKRDGTEVEVEQGTVHIVRYKGKGGKVTHVWVQLTDEGIAFFRGITAGRPASAPMLQRAYGGRWRRSQQTRLMEEASKGANIDPPVGFHTLRHTWASQAVKAGMPLFVVARNLGHKDTRMVEKHYGHLAPSYVAEQVQLFAPRFGSIPEDDNVTPLHGAG
jgi:integrase